MAKFYSRFLLVAATLGVFAVKATSAQINFSEDTPRLAAIETSVNDCALKQEITVCLNALAHGRMLRSGITAEPMSADKIMMETVELVPLYVLGRLAQMDGDEAAACAYARGGGDSASADCPDDRASVRARSRRLQAG